MTEKYTWPLGVIGLLVAFLLFVFATSIYLSWVLAAPFGLDTQVVIAMLLASMFTVMIFGFRYHPGP